jgi:GTP-binding protein
MTQVKTRPPGFVLSCTRPESVPDSYVRYLVNSLRDAFDLPGVPVRVALRAGENPYAPRK